MALRPAEHTAAKLRDPGSTLDGEEMHSCGGRVSGTRKGPAAGQWVEKVKQNGGGGQPPGRPGQRVPGPGTKVCSGPNNPQAVQRSSRQRAPLPGREADMLGTPGPQGGEKIQHLLLQDRLRECESHKGAGSKCRGVTVLVRVGRNGIYTVFLTLSVFTELPMVTRH